MIFSKIRNMRRKLSITSHRDLHNYQGKTNTCIVGAAESSHFFTDGAYTYFKDWRFIHRARLGLVKLNGYNKPTKAGSVNKKCCRCHLIKTLPHVLDHCMVHSTICKKGRGLCSWKRKSPSRLRGQKRYWHNHFRHYGPLLEWSRSVW